MNETGNIIQELRIKAGFTQRSLAEALHITDKAISKWERSICLPDVSLLPKLSLLLDVDLDLLVSKRIDREEWVGLIDIQKTDFSQLVYDKPLVYYLLIHYLLLDIRTIYVLTDDKNKRYLDEPTFYTMGFRFIFEAPKRDQNLMVLNHPWFIFGSDLTHQFLGSMLTERNIKLIPENQEPVCFFSHGDKYITDRKKFMKSAASRTLGRGMVCLDMEDHDKMLDVGTFIRTYQKNSGLLIGSLEEVAYRKGLISLEKVKELSNDKPYAELLYYACKP